MLKSSDLQSFNLHVPGPASPVSKEGEPCLYTVPGLGGEILMPKMLEKISRADGDGFSDPGEDNGDAPTASHALQGNGQIFGRSLAVCAADASQLALQAAINSGDCYFWILPLVAAGEELQTGNQVWDSAELLWTQTFDVAVLNKGNDDAMCVYIVWIENLLK